MEPFFFLMIVLGMWAFVYFVGGAIVGRLSAGYTVKETVIASLIAFFLDRIVVHMGLHQPMDWVYFLVGLIIAFVVALLGASLGESLQQRAAKALAPRPRGPQQPSPAQPARR
jgi:polyferredoxin